MKSILLLALMALTVRPCLALVQPDISAIGDFRANTGNWKNLDGAKTATNGNLNMGFEELEIAFSGYLNPYAKGDVVVATPGEGLDLEEAFITFTRGLPLKSQLRVGQFLVDFGRLNSSHAHTFSFIDRPMAHQVYFGEEGFKDQGANLSLLLPTGFYSKLSINVLKGDFFGEDRNSVKPAFSSRLSLFLPVGQKGNLDAGLSGLTGIYSGSSEDQPRNLRTLMWAFDAKYKIKWSDYQSLTLQGELIGSRRDTLREDLSAGRVATWSGFGSLDFRFHKRYNAGLLFDYAPGLFDGFAERNGQEIPEELDNTPRAPFDPKNHTTGITVFTGFSLLEETTLIRLACQYLSYSISDPTRLANVDLRSKPEEWTVQLQLIWSLGPHKPHEF